jgi:hypothetical protein
VLGCLILVILCSNSISAQIFSPSININSDLSEESMTIALGDISINAKLYGYKSDEFIDLSDFEEIISNPLFPDIFDVSLIENLHISLLAGSSNITNINKIILFDISSFNKSNLTEQDIQDIFNNFKEFNNVNLQINNGMSIFGTNGEEIKIDEKDLFSIAGFAEFPFQENITLSVMVFLSPDSIKYDYTGDEIILFPMVDTTNFIIKNEQGSIIQNISGSENILIIQDNDISIIDDSPVHLFPITGSDSKPSAELTVKPTNKQIMNLPYLLNQIKFSNTDFNLSDIPLFEENNSFFNDVFSIMSNVINGGFVIVNTSKQIIIDNSNQQIKGIGFFRGNQYSISLLNTTEGGKKIDGYFKIAFLGDHFYNSQAKESENGVGIPLIPIIYWIIIIAFYFICKYYLKIKPDETEDKKLKTYGLIFHIALLVISFILVDSEISHQFGVSMLSLLFSSGFSIFTAGFGLIQLILWIFGYIAFAIPSYILLKYLLAYFGYGKKWKGFEKGIAAFFISVFPALYTITLINIIFLFIEIPTIGLPM